MNTLNSNINTDFRSLFFGLITIIFLLASNRNVYSQNPKTTFREVDQNSYQLYLDQNWDSLISYGNYAIGQGHDYANLRLRLGIAYFNLGNYFKATDYLLKSESFNNDNPVTKEYLNLSYIYANRTLEAQSLMYVPKEKREPGFKRELIESINLETGPIFSNNITRNKNENLFSQKLNDYAEKDLNDWKYYNQVGIKIKAAKFFSIYIGYNNLLISKVKQIQFKPVGPIGILSRIIEDKYKLHQNGIYSAFNILIAKGIILTPAFHYINVNYTTIYTNFPTTQGEAISVIEKKTNLNNLLVSLGVNKTMSVFNVGIFGSYSDLNYKKQFQTGGSFSWFPAGNLDLYTTSKLVFAFEEGATRPVFDQLIGFKAASHLWLEGSLTFGKILNYNENNAYVVYNSSDLINFRAGGNIIVPLDNGFELSFRYQYAKFESEWFRESQNSTETFNTDYNNNLIIGGIKWTF